MSNLFTRIKNTIVSDIHEMIDQKEEKNPIATLNQYLRESEKEVEQISRLMDRQRKLKDQFSDEYDHAIYMRDKRDKQAEIAKKAEELSLFEFATKEKNEYAEQAVKLKESLQKINQSIKQLEEKYRTMQLRLKEMHFKRLELMGKENTIRMNHRMNQLIHEDEQSSNKRIREIERYMDRLEAKVSREYEQLTFDDKIEQLEKNLKAN